MLSQIGRATKEVLEIKYHTGQTKAPNANHSPLVTMAIHKEILFATISTSLCHWNERESCVGSMDMALLSSSLPLSALLPAAYYTIICGSMSMARVMQKASAYPHTCLEKTGPKCQPGLPGLLQKMWDPTSTSAGS